MALGHTTRHYTTLHNISLYMTVRDIPFQSSPLHHITLHYVHNIHLVIHQYHAALSEQQLSLLFCDPSRNPGRNRLKGVLANSNRSDLRPSKHIRSQEAKPPAMLQTQPPPCVTCDRSWAKVGSIRRKQSDRQINPQLAARSHDPFRSLDQQRPACFVIVCPSKNTECSEAKMEEGSTFGFARTRRVAFSRMPLPPTSAVTKCTRLPTMHAI